MPQDSSLEWKSESQFIFLEKKPCSSSPSHKLKSKINYGPHIIMLEKIIDIIKISGIIKKYMYSRDG